MILLNELNQLYNIVVDHRIELKSNHTNEF